MGYYVLNVLTSPMENKAQHQTKNKNVTFFTGILNLFSGAHKNNGLCVIYNFNLHVLVTQFCRLYCVIEIFPLFMRICLTFFFYRFV